MKTTVVNVKHDAYDLKIMRGTPWGNPFIIGVHGTREQVIARYREWVVKQKHLMDKLHELRGKRLGCCCKPLACHGDILVELCELPLTGSVD